MIKEFITQCVLLKGDREEMLFGLGVWTCLLLLLILTALRAVGV